MRMRHTSRTDDAMSGDRSPVNVRVSEFYRDRMGDVVASRQVPDIRSVSDIIQDAIYMAYSVLFLIIIVNVSCNPNCILKLENKVFVVLGNISYGIYMYHMIVIAFVIGTLKMINFTVDNSFTSQILVYSSTILGTILVAWLSYTYLESFFLKLKRKFTVIKSGFAN